MVTSCKVVVETGVFCLLCSDEARVVVEAQLLRQTGHHQQRRFGIEVLLRLRVDQDGCAAIHNGQELKGVVQLSEVHLPVRHRLWTLDGMMLLYTGRNAVGFGVKAEDSSLVQVQS
jgi:hypothetical protein